MTCDTLKEKIEATKLSVVFFGDVASREFSEVFLNVAQNPTVSEKFQFFNLNDAACATSFGASAPGLVLFRKFDEPQLLYSGSLEVTPVVDWMVASSVPTLMEFSEDAIEPMFGQRKTAIILFRSASQANSDFANQFKEASQKLKGEILFVVSGVTDGIQ